MERLYTYGGMVFSPACFGVVVREARTGRDRVAGLMTQGRPSGVSPVALAQDIQQAEQAWDTAIRG